MRGVTTGLTHFRARDLNPELGHLLSVDTARGEGIRRFNSVHPSGAHLAIPEVFSP